MEFRLLGPVELCTGDRLVPVRGPRMSAVLATLLLHRNRWITVPHLGRASWVTPPRSFESNVRTFVARLRSLFVQSGEVEPRVLTGPTGYQLVVHDGELDLAVFDERVRAGRAAAVRAQPVTAMRHLEQALRLWRGDPLAGLTVGPALEAEAARLEERLLMAVLLWADAALAAGHAQRVAAELSRRVRERPLREQLWARLMLALYRCDRQADALTAYRRMYRLFRTELDVAPGHDLQRLHRQILHAHPDLDRWSGMAGPATVEGTPPASRSTGSPRSR